MSFKNNNKDGELFGNTSTDNQYDLVLGAPEEDDLSKELKRREYHSNSNDHLPALSDEDVEKQIKMRQVRIFLVSILLIMMIPLIIILIGKDEPPKNDDAMTEFERTAIVDKENYSRDDFERDKLRIENDIERMRIEFMKDGVLDEHEASVIASQQRFLNELEQSVMEDERQSEKGNKVDSVIPFDKNESNYYAVMIDEKEEQPSTIPPVAENDRGNKKQMMQNADKKYKGNMTETSEFTQNASDEGRKQVEAVCRSKQSDIISCYEQIIQNDQTQGRLTVILIVDKTGSVMKIDKLEDEIGGEMYQCVKQRIKNWNFGKLDKPIVFKKTWIFN